ncbi:MAG: galactitol-1-phosphate 5-dehydrogenase [Fuerstiella sp.]|nr:galactitol-1-phosphate 5-dehydrogenase [Fuerstiella sp.]MCP4854170.1 galactitol-1-phosphate 5-dehydrogenase [Fuerstiella sp.]
MKALLLSEYKRLEITDIPTPEIGPEDVLVQVKSCGICGSDIHGWDGSSGRRVPPLVMGHEAAGVVAAVGKNVQGLVEGNRITFDSTVWCGKCHFCLSGRPNLCDNRMVLGVSCDDYRRYGCFAEYVSVPARICCQLPDCLPFEHAALIEAVSVAVHAANRTPVSLGDTAVVVGTGMIGLLVIQAIRQKGCSQVIATDLNPQRLEVARKLGADVTINVSEEDAAPRVAELTNGRGADVALEVVGATATINSAIDCTRKGGSVTIVGNLAPTIELPLQSVVTRELNIFGTCASAGEYPACVDLLAAGMIKVEDMITAKAPLEQGHDWFSRLYEGEAGAMKVVLCPAM